MKSEVKKLIEKGLEKYKQKDVKILDKQYTLYIVPELCDEDLNIFEGFLFVEADNKSEVSYLKTRYKPPVSGYAPRIGIILYDSHLLLKDYRKNKHIIKTLKKINKTFLNKLKKALSDPKEENLSSKLFDRSDVIEEFYILYKRAREYLLKNIKGIPEEEKREEFVDNFMMQMLTLWYLQERGFFNNDKNYFITKFKESKQKKLFGEFKNYYEFLSYFFEKVSNNLDSQYYEDKIVGKVVVIGPAVFLNGEHSKAISIPDKCFYKEGMTDVLINTPPKKVSQEVPLLNLFESRDWTEGNIDEFVLGAIYEKLITYMERKKLGAYYTPEITSYICKNTIEPYLVDRVNEKFKRNFETIDQIIESNDREILLYLFEQLKEIKILDPAVGSAHFLESAINVLVSIYEKIREKAIELGIKKGLEIIAADEKGEIKTINLLEISDDEFKLLIKFFIILSKNIYGVDINPSALKVAKARLFLTLAKHFKAGKEKDIFIRFPNVHFNLREGNSLIGYVDIKRQKPKGQLQLDFFIEEEQSEYITEKIKIVSELKPYLEKTAKSLNLDGNIVEEVKELNKILAKRKIDWNDFEKVLRTKEKLITILIASLNSKHAKPLNDLLNEFTNLFNQKLDEKFAEEHNIKLEDLKKIKTFHWIFEFPEVFLDRDGFDVVVGNPPYGDILSVTEKKITSILYSEYNEIAADFIDLSISLLKCSGRMGMITTIAIMKNSKLGILHRKIEENLKNVKIASFARRPTKIFPNAEINVAIITACKGRGNGSIMTSDFIRFKGKIDLQKIEYSPISGLILGDNLNNDDVFEVLPAVGPSIKRSILLKLMNKKRTIKDCLGSNYELYFRRTANYWMNVSIEKLKDSKNMIRLTFKDELERNFIFLVMNSTLFYMYWWTYCNMHDVNKGRVLKFPIPEKEEMLDRKEEIQNYTKRLWAALLENYDPSQHHQFNMVNVKPIIDEIEEFIGEFYNLNKDEIKFLQTYHSEFGRKSARSLEQSNKR